MKNTEMIKLENILTFKGEFDKVHKLEDVYNARQASKLFGCTMSQVKGYLNNYKQYFEGHVKVVGTPGKQETLIDKEGMFLLAILLDNKSELARKVANRVRNLIANPVKEIKKAKKEIKKEEPQQLEMNLEELLKHLAESPSKATKVEEEIKIESDKPKTEKAQDKKVQEKKQPTQEDMQKELNEISSKLLVIDLIKDICEMKAELEQKVYVEETKLNMLDLTTNLKENNMILSSYLEKCTMLGLEELESAIILQESFVNDKDPDKEILNALYKQAKAETARKRGVLKESIELLASEKFNGQVQDAYYYLSNELRFCMGVNMKKIRIAQKHNNVSPSSYLDMIIEFNGFDFAMDIITTLLSE